MRWEVHAAVDTAGARACTDRTATDNRHCITRTLAETHRTRSGLCVASTTSNTTWRQHAASDICTALRTIIASYSTPFYFSGSLPVSSMCLTFCSITVIAKTEINNSLLFVACCMLYRCWSLLKQPNIDIWSDWRDRMGVGIRPPSLNSVAWAAWLHYEQKRVEVGSFWTTWVILGLIFRFKSWVLSYQPLLMSVN